ncbi:MAG TPA: extracellular solute-binding protein [Candidatus Limnocylindrales bacterium]|nr:extracellular solute-binding protein [Candidatus Limnocylindrales bacterium]
MNQGSRRWRGIAALAGAGLLAVVACTPAAETGGTEVSVIGTWGGSEQESFLAMVAPWEESTGNTVKYTGTRDINAVLTTGVASGILPDLAGLPGPGQMTAWAQAGALKPLDEVLDLETYRADTSPAFVDLGTVDGKVVGVFIKSALKGLIWYNPNVFSGSAPTTWEAVMGTDPGSADSLWCVGIESGAASGWAGTDWIEDFVLRQSGPDVYDAWVNGTHAWSSPEIKSAFEAFGEVLDASFGGADTVVSTNFGAAGNPLFTDPPGCLFHHQASFITDFFKEQGGAADGDFDFFPMPDINPSYAGAFTGAGDLFGMFNDTPAARDLLKYLVTAEAQQIWVSRGGALSGNTKVTEYPDEVSARSAAALGSAKIFRFDGGDLMPTALQSAFFKAMVDFTQDQSALDSILAELDAASESARGG